MYGFIYLTTNLINNKKYIGKKKYTYGWEDYLGSGKKLALAIEKYGKENFRREIICECQNEEELNTMEKFYIKEYNAVKSNEFYNMSAGGNGGMCWKVHPHLGKKKSVESIRKSVENRTYKKGSQHHGAKLVEYMNTGEIGCIREIEFKAGINNKTSTLGKLLNENGGYYRFKKGIHKGKEFRFINVLVTEEMKLKQSKHNIYDTSKKVLYINENIIDNIKNISLIAGVDRSTLGENLRENNGYYEYKIGKNKGKKFKILD